MDEKISNIAQVITGHTFRSAIPHKKDGNFAVAQAKDINLYCELKHPFTKTYIEKTRAKGIIESNDILLTNRGTFRAVVYKGNGKNLIASSSIYILRIKDFTKVLPEYLAIYLNSKAGQQNLDSKNRGATIKSLPKYSLLEVKIPILAFEKQKKIIGIYKNQQKRNHLYQRKSQLYKEITYSTINKLITS